MEQDYLIAGHRIRVEGDRLVQRIEALPGFPVFKTKSGGEPLCQFITTLNQAPVFEQVYYRSEIDGIVSRFGRYTDGYVDDTRCPYCLFYGQLCTYITTLCLLDCVWSGCNSFRNSGHSYQYHLLSR